MRQKSLGTSLASPEAQTDSWSSAPRTLPRSCGTSKTRVGMSVKGQTEKSHAVTRRSVNRQKADILGGKRFVALSPFPDIAGTAVVVVRGRCPKGWEAVTFRTAAHPEPGRMT